LEKIVILIERAGGGKRRLVRDGANSFNVSELARGGVDRVDKVERVNMGSPG
jgi:hypothetical protein